MELFRVRVDGGFIFFLLNIEYCLDGIDAVGLIIVIVINRQKASTKIGKGMWVDVTAFAILS